MKRVIIMTGDARVGKSTLSRLLLDLYLSEGLKVHATYGGHRNKLDSYSSQLDIHKFNLERGDYDDFFGNLQNVDNINVVLMDLPGQILPEFIKFEHSMYLLEGLYSVGYRVTFLHPISFRKDCMGYLLDLITEFQADADYVIVKNEYFGDKFPYYDESIQSSVNKLGGITMHLPMLSKFTYTRVEEAGCTYSEASAKVPVGDIGRKVSVLERSLVFTWLNKFRTAIYSDEKLLEYFGLTV